jgi:hypothetical protein
VSEGSSRLFLLELQLTKVIKKSKMNTPLNNMRVIRNYLSLRILERSKTVFTARGGRA